jgi:hypothetical protein
MRGEKKIVEYRGGLLTASGLWVFKPALVKNKSQSPDGFLTKAGLKTQSPDGSDFGHRLAFLDFTTVSYCFIFLQM